MSLRLPLLLLLSALSSCAAQGLGFRCTSSTSGCGSLAAYVAVNTTYDAIGKLFQVNALSELYGANSISSATLPSASVPANSTVRVPFPCACTGGAGTAFRRPNYTVKSSDTLDFIARTTFQRLVTYKQIAAVNRVVNESLIEIGQTFLIPLPCSCDLVNGKNVTHLALVVAAGSTLSEIARQYGTSEKTLLQINNMSSAKDLLAGQVLDVPLGGGGNESTAPPPASSASLLMLVFFHGALILSTFL